MTNVPFEYEPHLVADCATSSLSKQILSPPSAEDEFIDSVLFPSNENHNEKEEEVEACILLFHLHSAHYQRNMEMMKDVPASSLPLATKQDIYQRLRRFLSNVAFVHEHNSDHYLDAGQLTQEKKHSVGLNQFSDLFEHELPLSPMPSYFSPFKSASEISDDENRNATNNDDSRDNKKDVLLTRLESEDSIKMQSQLLQFQTDNPYNFSSVEINSISPGSTDASASSSTLSATGQSSSKPLKKKKGFTRRVEEKHGVDPFAKSLNWATSNNPDGVGVVHRPRDQGQIGSCWAFSATGTLEASAIRHAGVNAMTSAANNSSTSDDINPSALEAAQIAQKKAFKIADFSVQELLDCDEESDSGLGNPILAFYFIHEHGLTSFKNYPYVAKKGQCNYEAESQPIVSVDSWGVLTSDYENNMELVIRHIGPIAVGFNGKDPSFFMYSGGIFNSSNCEGGSNHAMLIVGYGEEEVEDDSSGESKTIKKYWIVRNSWGEGWGEDGYVRVERNDGKRNSKSMCGIAESPSVALGGMLLFEEDNGVAGESHFQQGFKDHFVIDSDEKKKSILLCFGGSKKDLFAMTTLAGDNMNGKKCIEVGMIQVMAISLAFLFIIIIGVRKISSNTRTTSRNTNNSRLSVAPSSSETDRLIVAEDGSNPGYDGYATIT